MVLNEWLDTPLGRDIWKNKYRHENETLEEWFDRVSGGNKSLERLIREKKFLTGGRTLSNRGTGNGASYSNCYSSGYAPDSVLGMMNLSENLAMTYKSQGGQGLSLSKIRPKGTPIANGSFESDGIIPFMELFNQVTATIMQGGSRKGALMISLDALHKEIETFVDIKSDSDKINKANLSVEIDDDFMSAVREYYINGKIIQIPVKKTYEGNTIEYTITPIDVYKKIMARAYDWAEPGVILVEKFRKYNLMQHDNEYEVVTGNPCVSGDTKVLTNKGYFEIKSLVGKEVEVWNGEEFSKVSPVVTGTNQNFLEISLSDGSKLKCTPYHKFYNKDGEMIEAKDLNNEVRLEKFDLPIIEHGKDHNKKEMYTKGFFSGDGSIETTRNRNSIWLYGDKKELKECLDYKNINECANDRLFLTLDTEKYDNKTFVPDCNYSIKSRLSWLAGILDSDGTINDKGGSLSISSINKQFLMDIKHMLITLGCKSVVSVMKLEDKKLMPDGNGGQKEYNCKESYRIVISAFGTKHLYGIGLNTNRIKCIVKDDFVSKARYIKITNIKTLKETETSYCFTEFKRHRGMFNCVVTGQCGEQPLPKDGACNLGSMNLSNYVMNPHTDKAKFDMESFVLDVGIAIKGLDEILDEGMELHALESQKEMAKNYRNIGLGIMGLGDMFFKLRIKYGSEDSKTMLQKIMKAMFKTAVITSSLLAYQKGTYPKYKDCVFDSDIIKNHFNEKEIAEMRKVGLRNCSLLSIAPCGSIGTMLNITTGIEPAFQLSYNRKTESLHKDEEKSYKVYVGTAKEYMNIYNTKVLPDYFITSGEIYWKDRVDIQSIAQYSVDTAISSTVNLPNSATVQEIESLYLYAWEKDLKGITIYRDGCKRTGILTTETSETDKDNKEPELEWGATLQASDDLVGYKRKIMSGCGSLHVQAWFDPLDGRLMEIYLSKGSSGGCNSFMISLSRIISAGLRTGLDFDYAIDQLNSVPACPSYVGRTMTKKDTSKGTNCPSAIARVLTEMQKEAFSDMGFDNEQNEYIDAQNEVNKIKAKNIEKNNQGEIVIPKCPECSGDLRFEGGCNSCPECGWSKCE